MIQSKSQTEIERLRVGGKQLAEILRKLKRASKAGTAVAELGRKAEELISPEDEAAFYQYQPSGAPRAYPDSVCISVNDTIVHGIPSESDHVLADGDVVTVDMGLTHQGLITDAAISFVVGESNPQKDKLLDTCKQALKAGIEAAQPEGHVGDISAAIQEAVGDQYAIYRSLVGHGVGYSVHEEPTVPNFGMPGTGPEIPVGAVVAIEPMIGVGSAEIERDDDGFTYRTADGSLSAHFEHTVAITEDGPSVLTRP